MRITGSGRLVAVLCLSLTLAACQSSEERAAEHYQNALALIEEGDTDRAIVEFRNVFRLQGDNREARLDYAGLLRDQGRIEGAYGQYLRVVEQYPDDIPALTALSQIAVELQSWDEARRHGKRLLELAPDDPATDVISVNLAYADAIEAEDASARREAARQARVLLENRPDDVLLMRMLIDAHVRDDEFEAALALLDRALEAAPDDRRLYNTRLAVLAQLDRPDAIESQLLAMRDRFPGDREIDATLLRFYLSRDQADEAETFLRDVAADADGPAKVDATADLVQFVLQTRGAEAALAELAPALEGSDVPPRLEALRAGILFDSGEKDRAVSEMEALVARLDAEAGDAPDAEADAPQTDVDRAGLIKVALARMLVDRGNPVGARRLVEGVLEADPGQVEALRMKAAWLIEDDEADAAIALLRTALDQRPEDTEALTLTALAHSRNGNDDLSREFLSLAAEASNNAPDETLRYARALMADERYLPAEEVVKRALRIARGDLDLLETLGQIYVQMEDWPRATQVENQIRGIGEGAAPDAPVRERALNVANALQARRLGAQGRMEDAIAFLEDLAASGEGSAVDAQIAVVRARLASGEGDAALRYAQSAVEETPDNPALAFVLAATQAATGDYDAAEKGYRAILERSPEAEQVWINLIRVLNAKGDVEGAQVALERGLETLPDAMDLLWAQASFRERSGDTDGAIEIYEKLRERAPGSELVANNLASLLATARDDPASLDRAERMARRLRGSDVPAFQDTYGWIAYRQDNLSEALENLEPAAAALTDDPMVQYHLGMTYAGLDRTEDALATLRRALEVAGDDPRPEFDAARAEIDRLEAGAGAGGGGTPQEDTPPPQ